MARRKVAPVNYRVPFTTAQSDVSRTGEIPREWGWQFYQPGAVAKDMAYGMKQGLSEEGQAWRSDPTGQAKAYAVGMRDMLNPIPGTVEAGQSWKRFAAQPSGGNFAEAVGKSGLAAMDWTIAAEPALGMLKAGKMQKVAKIAGLGRY